MLDHVCVQWRYKRYRAFRRRDFVGRSRRYGASNLSKCHAEIERLQLGIRIVSLEMVDLVPPYQIKDEFNAVQTSAIEAQTAIQEAEEYRSAQLPKAQTTYNREVSKASSTATQTLPPPKQKPLYLNSWHWKRRVIQRWSIVDSFKKDLR